MEVGREDKLGRAHSRSVTSAAAGSHLSDTAEVPKEVHCRGPPTLSLLSPQRYVDGGFTGLQPVSSLEEPVITVSPFTGELDICPRDCPAIFFCFQIFNGSIQISIENLCRISYALFPPSTMVSPPGFLPA